MELLFEQVVPASVQDVFSFHNVPYHLTTLMRDWPGFRLLHYEGTALPGGSLWVEETVAGCIPGVLGFRHTIYEPPRRLGEELVHGPFSDFHHVHEFEDHDSGTLIRDRLRVSLPLHYGGECGMRWFVEPQIRKVFDYRHRALRSLVEKGLLNEVADQ